MRPDGHWGGNEQRDRCPSTHKCCFGPSARVPLKGGLGGGVQHPQNGAELLEAPEAPEKIFDWPKARIKFGPTN